MARNFITRQDAALAAQYFISPYAIQYVLRSDGLVVNVMAMQTEMTQVRFLSV